MLNIIDTHAHIDMPEFSNDVDSIIHRAKSAGVNRIINPGVTLESNKKAIMLSEKYEGTIFVALSIHPQNASEWNDKTYKQLLTLSNHKSVVAIGETALDFFKEYSPKDTQIEVLKQHIRLAKETGKPLIIHDREAHEFVYKILKEEKAYEVSGVMHCFSRDYDFALRCIDLGFYISFTGVITFPNAKEAQKTASKLPLENILIETDCPFLSPQIHRGKRNEPAYVVFVANKLSELQNVPVSEVINVTTSNAEKLFKLNY